jgi:SNF2 family DNA or RNA helicase
VRTLLGKYRWAISGTPVQNNLEEFFPFFSFLKVPHTGTIETFKNNYVGRNSTTDLRLQTLLRHIMIRRTHLDKIFGRPLLQLPGITSKTVSVEFNNCEKAIYKIVKNRFIAKIRTYARSGELDKKFQSIFVLYLRLRQLVGHILLVQQTLKDLLEAEDLEKLWRLTESELHSQGEDGSQAVLSQLRKMLSKTKDAQNMTSKKDVRHDPAHMLTENIEVDGVADAVGGTFGTAFKFRKYLRSLKDTGKWEQTIKRSLCHKCGGVPDNPHVTSCFHVYCKECIEDMLFNAAKTDKEKAMCLACDAEFEHCEPCRGFDEASNKVNSSMSGTPDHRARKSADNDENDLDWLSVKGSILPSAKTLAVKAQIQNWVAEDPEAKIIIFTQFRPMIRILGRMMQEEGWGWSQFHGAMSFAARDRALLDFANKPDIKVLLASLKAGGVGLNLTMASKVIIIDLWWNECVEQQAFCRCFRIGQTRPVDICRIGMLIQLLMAMRVC